MIRLLNVSKSYSQKKELEVVALAPTTVDVARGEFVAVIGPSGSGKTTLLSILGGMLAPTTGKVWFGDQSLYDTSNNDRAELRRTRIGFVFQTFNLIPYLTAIENVQVPLALAGLSATQQRHRANELLNRVGLGPRLHHKPGELSTGQQQRVALARTLANDPALILADEPTGNLDPESRERVLTFLKELCQAGGTVVMVTHDPIAASHANRTLHLTQGEVSELSRPVARAA